MPRFKVTNTSQKKVKGGKNYFLTEAGKLIKPGEHLVCNRLDNGTRQLVDAGFLGLEEGDFKLPSIFDDDKKKPASEPEKSVWDDDNDDDEGIPTANPASYEADKAEAAKEADADTTSEATTQEADADTTSEATTQEAAPIAALEPELTAKQKRAVTKAAKQAAKENRG